MTWCANLTSVRLLADHLRRADGSKSAALTGEYRADHRARLRPLKCFRMHVSNKYDQGPAEDRRPRLTAAVGLQHPVSELSGACRASVLFGMHVGHSS